MSTLMEDLDVELEDRIKDLQVVRDLERRVARALKEAGHAYSDMVSTGADWDMIPLAYSVFDALGQAMTQTRELVALAQQKVEEHGR